MLVFIAYLTSNFRLNWTFFNWNKIINIYFISLKRLHYFHQDLKMIQNPKKSENGSENQTGLIFEITEMSLRIIYCFRLHSASVSHFSSCFPFYGAIGELFIHEFNLFIRMCLSFSLLVFCFVSREIPVDLHSISVFRFTYVI